MMQILLIVHLLIVLALIGVVLLQKSEGGGLGIGGGGGGGASGGMGGFMTGRGSANFLSRTTAVLAACFMATSITLSILAGTQTEPTSILDTIDEDSDTPTLQDGGAADGEGDASGQSGDDGDGSSDPSVPIQ
ncbi:preprotein translocase subunit SecG [Fodinicurvata fenggangensis]|uniref:preprotein translocase subunit SecG n=1 Tax=Fodinicurvata fenggangensis TaxID=1121830 RepID=UPI00047CC126|nr:preprotein translocase subunit SecG [Fodinicurvata fenggangensis]